MSDTLELHAASPDELVSAHRNVFDIWGRGKSLEEHVRFRLNSPKHRLASWYVGRVAGSVAVSLGAYPVRFRIRGHEVAGIAIGSVYTVAEFRRRGFAAQLIEWVENQCRQNGVALSLLYSDIKPEYYARLGYVVCPSLEGWRDVREFRDESATGQQLTEIDAESHLEKLMGLYNSFHGVAPLSIARNARYWRALLQRLTDDRFYALATAGQDDWKGYLRLSQENLKWRITDYAVADQSTGLADQLYTAAFELAARGGAEQVGGWLPDSPAARKLFQLTDRPTEITMIKSLSPKYSFDQELIASTSRFCEIDHV